MISSFLMILSCERDIEISFEIPFSGNEHTVYSFLTEGDSSFIGVYQNKPVTEEFINTDTKGATFIFSDGTNTITEANLNMRTDKYVILPAELNIEYSMEVSIDENLYHAHSVVIPPRVSIDSQSVTFIDVQEIVDVNFNFKDTPDVNYYSVSISTYVNGELLSGLENIPNLRMTFSDETFKNENYTFTYPEIRLRDLFLVADSLAINLFTVSEEFYQFSKSVNQENSPLQSNFDPRTPIYGNISGANGVFCGFNKTSVGIKL